MRYTSLFSRWLRSLRRRLGLTKSMSCGGRRAGVKHSRRPWVECLEDRTVPSITLSPTTLAADTINVAYNQSISTSGGTGAVTLAVSNVQNAVPGLNVPSSGTGTLAVTGTPTATGTETFEVTATDSLNNTTTANFSITVKNPVPTLSNVSINSAVDLGNQATLTGSIIAPSSQPLTLDINWGDGSATQTYNLPAGATTFSESYTYANTGAYSVNANVGDGDYSNDLLYASTGGTTPNPGNLYVFDMANGSETVVGSLPLDNITEITANNAPGGQDWLEYGANLYKGQQFNINTGAAIGAAVANVTHDNFNAMTYIGNTLYATGTSTTGGTAPSFLFTLNPTTGTATPVGTTGATGINGPVSGIAYNAANNTLYGIEGGSTSPYNLVSLSLSTGAATVLFSAGTTSFGSLGFGPDGNLYAGTSTGLLDLINLTNHTATPLGNFAALPSASAISGLTMGNDTTNVQTTVNTAVTLSPATLPADTVDVAYNQTITASGGTGAITLAVSNIQNAIPGLTVPSSGTTSLTIGGTPTASGTETFTVTTTDAAGDTSTTNYSITANLAITLSALTADTVNIAYNQTITASGGTGAVTLAVNVTTPVPGLIVPSSGTGSLAITGTPTEAGTETFTLTATDSLGGTTTADYSITVNPAVTLSPNLLPPDTTNVAYNQSISASGGTGAITLAVSNIQNAIPGLIVPNSGAASIAVTGTPTAFGTETFTVTATDSLGATATADYSITVNPAVNLSPTALPADTVNVPYNQAYNASGTDNAFYANQVVSYAPGTIPDAGYDNPAAALGGLNPVVGSYGGSNYYLTPFDPAYSSSDLVEVGAGGSLVLKLAQTASTDGYTIGVHTGFGLADADYPNGTNTDPASYFNSFLRQADVLVSADGVNWGNLGTITFDNPSNYDAGSATDPDGLSPGVGPAANPGQPFLGSLSSFDGQDWQGTLAVLNGSAGGTWLNLSGVTDENGNPIAGVNYIEFSVPNNPPLDPNTLNPEIMMVDAVVGTNSGASISANGGTGNITLTVSNVQNAIPGLSVPNSGTNGLSIGGAPTATGTETFTVTATDSLGGTTTANYSITVNPAVTLSPSTLPADAIDAGYNQSIDASGGTGAVTLAVSNIQNAIPGLSVPSSGINGLTIGGAPTVAGTETFMVTATDALGSSTGPQPYSVTVNPAGTLTLSPGTLASGAVGSSYGPVGFSASGGFGAYVFTLMKGNHLPAGVTLNLSGTLGGTPSAAGTFAFTIVATDNHDSSLTGQGTYSITVTPALAVSPAALPAATVGNTFSKQLTASGGSGAGYVFTASALPAGLTLSSAGLLSGTPTSALGSPFHFTVTATDSASVFRNFSYSLTVDPALELNPGSLSVATVGDRFSTQLKSTGGSGKGNVFTSTALPAWLTLSSTGLLSGMPPATADSSASFTVTVIDSNKGTTSAGYTLSVDPALLLSPTTLTVVTVGNPFATQLTAAGGSGAGYVFAGGNLPVWMTLSSAGLLSGTPTTAAGSPFHFTVAVTDSNAGTVRHTYSLSVNPALVVKPIPLPAATAGDNYHTQLTASGGSGMGYSFMASGLPGWLTLSSGGLLNGMPPAPTVLPLDFTVTVTDSNSATGSHTYALTVDPALSISPGTLGVATVGDRFSTQLKATGGSGKGYSFTGDSLPAWLKVSSTGLLSGTPPATASSSSSFMVTVTDNAKGAGSASYTLSVDPALLLSPTTLTVVTVGNPFSTQLTAAGGSGTGYVFTGVNLPGWITLSSSGLLSGTPTTAIGSPFHFTVTAADSNAGTVSHAYSLTVNPALAIKPTALVATMGDILNTQLKATGGSGMGYAFTASGLPAWLTLTSTGLLSGMPPATTGSPLAFTVTVTDSNSATGSHAFSLTIDPALTITAGTLGVATTGDKFSTQLTAAGGSGTGYRFTASSLPAGLTLSSAGLLSGTPTAAAGSPFLFTVTLTDSNGGSVSHTYSLAVNPALVVTPGSLLVATVGDHYSTQLTATGGSGAGYVFTAVNLPAGLTLSSAGLLSGTPTTAGSPFHFTVIVTDGIGGTLSRTFSLKVNPPLAINPSSLPTLTVGHSFITQLTVTGGSGAGYTFTGTGLPAGLTLSSIGLLSGTPTTATIGPLLYVVTATDSDGGTGSRTYSLIVLP
jgi:large repetitive protein